MINAQAMAVRNGRAIRKQKYIAIAASKVRNPNVTHLLAWRLCDCGSIRSPFSPSAIRESRGLCVSLACASDLSGERRSSYWVRSTALTRHVTCLSAIERELLNPMKAAVVQQESALIESNHACMGVMAVYVTIDRQVIGVGMLEGYVGLPVGIVRLSQRHLAFVHIQG